MAISVNDKYFQNYKSRMEESQALTAHDFHIVEFEQMCQEMITKALEAHDEQLQVDVQTTLNGRPCTMSGLVSDVKKQVYDALRKAFRK